MTAKLSLSIILVTLLLLLGSLTLASLPSRNDSIPGIHPVAGAVPNVLGLDCAYGSNAEGGAPFPSSVTASAPYSAPDFDGTLDSSCLATYLADTGALEPLASDNPAVVAPGSGGGLTIDVVASLNATTTINGFDISVQYDPHYLNGVIIDQSGLIWGGNGLPAGAFVLTLAKTLDNVNGVARVAQVLVGAPQQSGTSELFRVRFDLVGANPSTGVHIVSDTLTNPGNVQHTTNAATSIDTTMIYDFVAGVTLGAVASWTSSPSPAVPLSPLTFTATATCSGCTTPLSFSWDFSALDSTPRPLPAQATTNPATITPPAPVVNRVVLTITDAATHSIEITRLLPLVVRESPTLTTLAAGTASGAWSGQWLGGVTTATAGYSGGWTFCPGSALVKTVCSAPTVTVSQSGAGVTQTSSAGAENYLFAGLFNATLRISDAPELQVGTSPSGNVVIVNFFNNVTGATAAYTVAVTGNATSISPNQAINFTATPTYATTYPSNFRSNSFRYLWSFGDGSPTASTTNSPGLTSSFIVHTYTASGPHTVTVTATETANAAVTHIVEVGRLLISVSGGITPPTVVISCPTSGTVGVMVPCTATGSGGTTPYTFAWTATGGSPASGTGASFATTYTVKGSDTISVTLTDSESPAKTATASTTVTIAPVTLAVTISGPTTGSINSPLVFTANPSGGTTPYMYAWTATGGSPASGTGSSFTTMFATSGPQSVSVTVTDANAKTATASATVTISPTALTVTITCPTGGTVGSPVNCTATSSGGTQPVAFSWTAIGGSPSSGTGASFTTMYNVKGSVSISVTATDSASPPVTATQSATVTIAPIALAVTISGPTTGGVNSPLTFTANPTGGTTPYTFAWTATGGTPASGTGSGFTTMFATSGSKTVSVTVTDGNAKTATASVTVAISPAILTVSINCPTTGTVGSPVNCSATSSGGTPPVTFAWTATGGNPSTGTGASFATIYSAKGTVSISVTATDSASPAVTATNSATVTVAALVLAVTVSGPTTGGINTPLTFTANPTGGTTPYTFAWTATGGTPASGTSATFTTMFATSGSKTVSVTVTDANAKTATASATVAISPGALSVTITCPTTGTVNSPVACSATSNGGTPPVTFAWTATGGTPSSGTGASFTTMYSVKGSVSISVTATDSSSPALTATNSATVTISPLTLVVTITGPTTGTVGSAVTFTANPTGGTTLYTFAWTATGGSPASGTGATLSTTYNVKGSYTVSVTITDANAKTATASATIAISPLTLSVTIAGPTTGGLNAPLTFTAAGSGGTTPYTFAWTATGGTPSSGTGSSFITTYSTLGTFTVGVTVTDGNAKTATASATVVINQGLFQLITCPTTGTVNSPVACTATATGGTAPITFAWTATGGTPSSGTGASFSTTYSTKGSQLISVTATDAAGATATNSATVAISPLALTTDFTFPSSITPGTAATFTATTSGGTTPYTYAWTFGDGATGTGNPASHTYSTTGPFTVTLTVTDANAKTATATHAVGQAAVFTMSINCPTTGTVGIAVACTATSAGGTPPVTFSWTATGGNPSSGTGTSFSTTYNVKGTFSISVTGTDSASPATVATKSASVTIAAIALSADFTFTPSSPTNGTLVTFTATVTGGTTPYSYVWSFGDSTPTATGNPATHTYASPGTFTVMLTVTDSNGVSATASHSVTVTSIVSGQAVVLTFQGFDIDDCDNGVGQLTVLVNDKFVANLPPCTVRDGDNPAFRNQFASFGPFDITSFVVQGENTIVFMSPPPGHFSLVKNVTITQGDTVLLGVPGARFVNGSHSTTFTFSNPPLVVKSYTVNPIPVIKDATVTFTATFTGGSAPFTCKFTFGDGSPAVNVSVSSGTCSTTHSYDDTGNFLARVKITGQASTDVVRVFLQVTVVENNHDP